MTKFNLLVLLISLMISGCKSKTIEEMVGIYVNSNFDYDPIFAEIPYSVDTLILSNDYSFKSGYFGEGSFELKNNRIKLIYEYEFGSASYEAPIGIDISGNPKIILFKAKDHHYKKLE